MYIPLVSGLGGTHDKIFTLYITTPLYFKTKDIDFSFISQGKDNNPKHPDHPQHSQQIGAEATCLFTRLERV